VSRLLRFDDRRDQIELIIAVRTGFWLSFFRFQGATRTRITRRCGFSVAGISPDAGQRSGLPLCWVAHRNSADRWAAKATHDRCAVGRPLYQRSTANGDEFIEIVATTVEDAAPRWHRAN
jgi:hypothetical protein